MQCDLRGSGGAVGDEGDELRSGSFCVLVSRDMPRTRVRPERFGLINPDDGCIGSRADSAIAVAREMPGMVAMWRCDV